MVSSPNEGHDAGGQRFTGAVREQDVARGEAGVARRDCLPKRSERRLFGMAASLDASWRTRRREVDKTRAEVRGVVGNDVHRRQACQSPRPNFLRVDYSRAPLV